MAGPDRVLVGQLIDAACEDHEKARRLLSQHPDLLQARWVHGETALHFLAIENYAQGVRFLAENGADVNAPDDFGDAPLIDVATLGNDAVAEVLLAFGADPNATSETRDNVLHCAVRSGSSRLVRLLLRAGAHPSYLTDAEETVFDALPEDPERRIEIIAISDEFGARRRESDQNIDD